jgi:hypothetical protein
MPKLKDILPVLKSLGLPIGGTWAVVVAFWKSTTGDRLVDKHLILVLSAFVVSVVAFCVWWILKQRRKILLIQDSLSAPFRVSDDFQFDTDGYWIERKTGLPVCATCILPPTKIVSPLFEAIGSDFDGEPAMVWRCRKCGDDYFHKK